MKMRTRLWSLAAALCMALASVAYAAAGPVLAPVGVALAQVTPDVKHAPLAAIVAAAPATQALAAAEHATASASETRSRPNTDGLRQALPATATLLTAEVGLAGKVAAGKGCGKPPKKLTA